MSRAVGNLTGYGFSDCHGLLFCRCYDESTSGVFNNCYVEQDTNTTSPSDSASGGWNRTRNSNIANGAGGAL